MECKQCGCHLICKMKDYGGSFTPSLQWQNADGSAHYKTTDGKSFTCNIPDDVAPAASSGDTLQNIMVLNSLIEKIESISIQTDKIFEMVHALFRYTVDEQLKIK